MDTDGYSNLNQDAYTSIGDVNKTIQQAKKIQCIWGAVSVQSRAEKLKIFRDELLKQADSLAFLISQETGKPQLESLIMEVVVVIDLASYFIKRAAKILQPQKIKLHLLKNKASYIHYQARGVVGILSPWNFPMGIPIGQVFMALIAGNAVILKPSEKTPKIALKIKEIYDKTGLPKDLFSVVLGDAKVGEALVGGGIDYCVFTGSTQVGRTVAQLCAKNLIPCTLELGGKAAAVVCSDCDLERTARALVFGAFANSGQVCASVERVYAHKDIYSRLLELLAKETKMLRQGDPLTQEVDIGHMTIEKQVVAVEGLINEAVALGAKVMTGGERLVKDSLYFKPTVLADCNLTMGVMEHEIFGPVLPVMRVNSDKEAVDLSNKSSYGLLGYVFTKNKKKGRYLAEKMKVGTVMVNDTIITFGAPETPWGGFGNSGIGSTHSDEGLKELCQKRHVNESRFSFSRELWWFPYKNSWKQKILYIIKKFPWIFSLNFLWLLIRISAK